MAATTTGPTAASATRGNSIHSSLGTLAPLNTPTRRFYGSQVHEEPGVPNPNIYVVQPFKNASVPKDFVYAKKVMIKIILFQNKDELFRMLQILVKVYLIPRSN